MMKRTFDRRKDSISERVLVCKEDRESLTKAQFVVLTKLFSLLNLEHGKQKEHLQADQLRSWKNKCLEGMERGLSGGAQSPPLAWQQLPGVCDDLFFIEMSAFIVLLPSIFKLQLLVEERELESSLRREAVKFLETVA